MISLPSIPSRPFASSLGRLAFFCALTSLVSTPARAQRRYILEAEFGVIESQNMEIRGYRQANATRGWSRTAPTFRLEYWSRRDAGWNFGTVFQPLDLRFADTLKSDLNYRQQVYLAGEAARLHYQFPTLRFSANYPIYRSRGGTFSVRLGSSAIVRYAKVELETSRRAFSDTNLLALPVINGEADYSLSRDYHIVSRADFLPGISGNVFLDGLFDVFAGLQRYRAGGQSWSFGWRGFFGGYDPAKRDDYANRIFFNSAVIRYAW